MKTRPIIFNTDMVKAILRGQKRMTRRPVIPQPVWHPNGRPPRWVWAPCGREIAGVDYFFPLLSGQYCPFGVSGDRLWVRETFARHPPSNEIVYRADGEELPYGDGFDWMPKWTPAIHMPRSVARIFLKITGVWVERVQDITGGDAIMEAPTGQATPLENFHKTWDSLYAKRGLGWDANPWVWVVNFRRLDS